jgi:hypothetical protein
MHSHGRRSPDILTAYSSYSGMSKRGPLPPHFFLSKDRYFRYHEAESAGQITTMRAGGCR